MRPEILKCLPGFKSALKLDSHPCGGGATNCAWMLIWLVLGGQVAAHVPARLPVVTIAAVLATPYNRASLPGVAYPLARAHYLSTLKQLRYRGILPRGRSVVASGAGRCRESQFR